MVKKNEKNMLEELFLREKPAKIFIGLKVPKGEFVYATLLSKFADCTYSHTIKILNILKEIGLVDFEKTGRIKKVSLTDEGREILQHLDAMLKKFTNLSKKAKKSEKKSTKK